VIPARAGSGARTGPRRLPNGLSVLTVLYLVIATPRKNRLNVTGGTPGWEEAINALAMYHGNRITLN
jgi:putative transposase